MVSTKRQQNRRINGNTKRMETNKSNFQNKGTVWIIHTKWSNFMRMIYSWSIKAKPCENQCNQTKILGKAKIVSAATAITIATFAREYKCWDFNIQNDSGMAKVRKASHPLTSLTLLISSQTLPQKLIKQLIVTDNIHIGTHHFNGKFIG